MSTFTVFVDPDIGRPGTAANKMRSPRKGLASRKDGLNTQPSMTPVTAKTVAATPRRALGDVSNNSHVLKAGKTPGFPSARKASKKLGVRADQSGTNSSINPNTSSSSKLALRPGALKQANATKGLAMPASTMKATQQQQQRKETRAWWDKPVERMPMNDDDMHIPDPFQDKLARAFGDANGSDDALDLSLDEFAPDPFCFGTAPSATAKAAPFSASAALNIFNDMQDATCGLVGVPSSLDDNDDL
ncbi:hypothetical protein PTSG_11236 [Salpingoeca rosetta]|uniref:Uncharacterized protein n=1 Tax=Salpingoeca rosetta (strain ATCC 50818 / BSB-021) TaxID=946362 RepID=F2USU2_SALR5|nr:uncharacterized protein PTSG_11236 [Salpingoeca rosetta]EGD81201.1 hypothetical protein PTSG_11236 [Salpingoeca rosetta]|eukprot:XP_004987735.1 hypothetical protein PTSG_11236 [Salpingoeca rosetta]